MRESVMAFSPLVAVLYFLLFPAQFSAALFWMVQFLR